MAGLSAAVAGLASGIEWAAVRSLAVAGDVAKFAAGVALLSLGLAVTSEVVRATTLVAGSGAVATSEAAAEAAVATTRSASTTANRGTSGSSTGSRAVPLSQWSV